MRALAFLAVLFLSLCSSAAFPDYSRFIEPDENASARTVLVPGGGYAVVSISGVETLVLDSANNPVANESGIRAVLVESFFQEINYSQRIGAVRETLAAYNASRQPEEGECFDLTGMTWHACTDREGCLTACLVIPVCARAASTESFLYAMLDFNRSASLLDAEVDLFGSELGDAKEGGLPVFEKLNDRLSSIKAASAEMNRNPLIASCPGCFSYCSKIGFDYPLLQDASAQVNLLASDYAGRQAREDEASGLVAKSEERLGYLSGRSARSAELSAGISAALSDFKPRLANLSQYVLDTGLDEEEKRLEMIAAEYSSLAAQGLYRQAFSRGEEFLSRADEFNGSLSAREAQYAELKAFVEDAGEALQEADRLLPANSSLRPRLESLKQEHARLKDEMVPPIRASELEPLGDQAADLKNEAEEMAEAGKPGGQEGAGLACALPLLVFAALAALALRRA